LFVYIFGFELILAIRLNPYYQRMDSSFIFNFLSKKFLFVANPPNSSFPKDPSKIRCRVFFLFMSPKGGMDGKPSNVYEPMCDSKNSKKEDQPTL
jgi:hypothetical protein